MDGCITLGSQGQPQVAIIIIIIIIIVIITSLHFRHRPASGPCKNAMHCTRQSRCMARHADSAVLLCAAAHALSAKYAHGSKVGNIAHAMIALLPTLPHAFVALPTCSNTVACPIVGHLFLPNNHQSIHPQPTLTSVRSGKEKFSCSSYCLRQLMSWGCAPHCTPTINTPRQHLGYTCGPLRLLHLSRQFEPACLPACLQHSGVQLTNQYH